MDNLFEEWFKLYFAYYPSKEIDKESKEEFRDCFHFALNFRLGSYLHDKEILTMVSDLISYADNETWKNLFVLDYHEDPDYVKQIKKDLVKICKYHLGLPVDMKNE